MLINRRARPIVPTVTVIMMPTLPSSRLYALGLEPSNSHICGRRYHEERGTLPVLKAFEKETIVLKIQILEGKEELEAVQKEAERYIMQ